MQNTILSANYFSRSINENLDALEEYAKQGYEAAQATNLASSALLGANVTGMKTAETANFLTGVLAQFSIQAEDSTRVIDKLNEVDNNFAVTSYQLAASLLKAGEAGDQFGVSLDNLIGYTTAIGTATRESGKQIGNMLKTTLSRINMDEAQDALNELKIAVKDISGELRPVADIYADLAVKWNTLTREQKMNISVMLAGRFHVTRFMALMDNFGLATNAAATSQKSLGSAIEENYKHQNSLQAQIARLTNSAQEFAFQLGENGVSGGMRSIMGIMTQYIKGLTEITTSHGNAATTVGVLSLAIVALRPVYLQQLALIKSSTIGMTLQSGALGKLTLSWAALGATMTTVAGIARSTMIALATNPLTWILTAVAVIPMILGHMKQVREEQEMLNQKYQEAKEKLDEIKILTDQIGAPTLQNINDLEAQIKMMDKFIIKLKEIDKEQRKQSSIFGYENQSNVGTSINDLSKENRDYLTSFGIDVNNVRTVEEAIRLLNERIAENTKLKNEAQINSTEYQEKLINESQSNVQLAQSTVDLIDEYEKLKNAGSLNEEQSKRLNEVFIILSQQFPDMVNGSQLMVDAIKTEAKERLKLAETYLGVTKQQLTSNRQAVMDQYNTAIKMITLYQQEAKYLYELVKAKIAYGQALDLADFKIIEGAGNAEESANDASKSVNKLAETLAKMDKVLFNKPSLSLGDDKKGSSPSYSGLQKSVEKWESAFAKIQAEYEEMRSLLERKVDLGIVRGLEIAEQELKLEEDRLNKLFDIRSENQKNLKKWQAELNVLDEKPQKARNAEYYEQYKSIQKIIADINSDIAKQNEEEEKQLAIVQKQTLFRDQMKTKVEDLKKKIEDVISKVKDMKKTYDDAIQDIDIEKMLYGNTVGISSYKSVFENALERAQFGLSLLDQEKSALENWIISYEKVKNDLRKIYGEKLDIYIRLRPKIEKGETLSREEQIEWDEIIEDTEDMTQAFRDHGVEIKDVEQKRKELDRAIKQSDLARDTISQVQDATSALQSFSDRLKQMELDEQLNDLIESKYAAYKSILQKLPTTEIELFEQELENTKSQLQELLSKAQELEKIRLEIDTGTVEEKLNKIKDMMLSNTLPSDLKQLVSQMLSDGVSGEDIIDNINQKLAKTTTELNKSARNIENMNSELEKLKKIEQIKEIFDGFSDSILALADRTQLNKMFGNSIFGNPEDLINNLFTISQDRMIQLQKIQNNVFLKVGDKAKQFWDLLGKDIAGTLTDSEKELYNALKNNTELKNALWENGVNVKQIIDSSKQLILTFKNYETAKEAANFVGELNNKIQSLKDKITEINFDKSFDLFFNDKYKDFLNIFDEAPTNEVERLEGELDKLKTKFDEIINTTKELEEIKFELQTGDSSSKVDEYKTKIQESIDALKTATTSFSSGSELLVNESVSSQINNVLSKGFEWPEELSKGTYLRTLLEKEWEGSLTSKEMEELNKLKTMYIQFGGSLPNLNAYLDGFNSSYNVLKNNLSTIPELSDYVSRITEPLDEYQRLLLTHAPMNQIEAEKEKLKTELQNVIREISEETFIKPEVEVEVENLQNILDSLSGGSFEEAIEQINEMLNGTNGELNDVADNIREIQEELEKARQLEKIKDIFKNLFSFEDMFDTATDEFGNVIHTISGQMTKILKESSQLADELFVQLKEGMSDTLLNIITNQEDFWAEIFSSGGFDNISDSLDSSFADIQEQWQETLSEMGTDAVDFFAGTDFGNAMEALEGKMSNFGGLLGDLLSASLMTIPTIVTNVVQQLPVYFEKLNTSLTLGVSTAVVNAINSAIHIIENSLRVDMPDLTIQPTVTQTNIENNRIYDSSLPQNITYAYSFNLTGNLITNEMAMRDLAITIMRYMNEIRESEW